MIKPYFRPVSKFESEEYNKYREKSDIPEERVGGRGVRNHQSGEEVASPPIENTGWLQAVTHTVLTTSLGPDDDEDEVIGEELPVHPWKGNNYEVLKEKLSHLPSDQQQELLNRILKHPAVFKDTPGLTTWAAYDIDVGDSHAVKLAPYRVNPARQKALEEELQYIVNHRLIKMGLAKEG
ncbi:hypothetical protein Pcinc_002533 [Petrolisthes cinctipes]|uniref:Uncharacterized protein n=1 Tax=Petrolisthes cinctipes TaxID=88211 RepID=A0AAE1L238_PETCI|nr:hypothetical protein Pcinc_017335 [Petrolisthes cinctipes]KAK3893661.1 hypothetical protein Pcinc_002533 [Petrolisthes cinctipes]